MDCEKEETNNERHRSSTLDAGAIRSLAHTNTTDQVATEPIHSLRRRRQHTALVVDVAFTSHRIR